MELNKNICKTYVKLVQKIDFRPIINSPTKFGIFWHPSLVVGGVDYWAKIYLLEEFNVEFYQLKHLYL